MRWTLSGNETFLFKAYDSSFVICLHTYSTSRKGSHLDAVKTFVDVCFQGVRSGGLARRAGDANAKCPPGFEIGSNLEFYSISSASCRRAHRFHIGSKQPLHIKLTSYVDESEG